MNRLPLDRLHRSCTLALAVYLHLIELAAAAGRHRKLTTDRRSIVRKFGVKGHTASRAMLVLRREKLITYRVRARTGKDGRAQGKYYEISLCTGPLNGSSVFRITERTEPQKGASVKTAHERTEPQKGLLSSKEDRTADGGASLSAPPAAASNSTAAAPEAAPQDDVAAILAGRNGTAPKAAPPPPPKQSTGRSFLDSIGSDPGPNNGNNGSLPIGFDPLAGLPGMRPATRGHQP